MPTLLGPKIQHLRRVHSMTQGELARYLSLATPAHISNIEAGRKHPSLELVIRISVLLGEQTDYILKDTIEIKASNVRISTAPPRSKLVRLSALDLLLYKQHLGRTLHNLRQQDNIAEETLANNMNVPVGHIRQLEHAQSDPSIAFVLRLADFFTVSTDYLLLAKPQNENIARS